MNKKRREEIKSVVARLKVINEDLSDIQSEEQDSFDNIPENLRDTDKAATSEESIDVMDDAIEQIGEVIDGLTGIV